MDFIVKKFSTSVILSAIFYSLSLQASTFYPSNILKLDSVFSHHILLVEKSTHSLYLYTNQDGKPKFIKQFKIATGKIKGNKSLQGDRKTPEGIYTFQRFHSDDFLMNKYGDYGKIYGAGAFTTNYPNVIDRRAGKTGGGIWLHSTDDDTRVNKGLDSRGCVVAVDQDLKEISRYLELMNTQIVIVQNINFLKEDTWLTNKQELEDAVLAWAKAWKEKDFNTYISSYSKALFRHPIKGRFNAFRTYKRAVFSRSDKPVIEMSNISILMNKDYAVVTMKQDYSSPVVNDIGKKVLYFQRNSEYEWKIVSEQWSKLSEPVPSLAFTPKMRFFTKKDSKKVTKNDSGSI